MKRFILPIAVICSLFFLSCAKNGEKYNVQGMEKQKLGNYKEAIELFTKAISIDQYFVEAYINSGNAYFDLQSYYEAISDFNKAIELNNNYATAYFKRGFAYMKLKDFSRAIPDFTKAIELNPNYSEAYSNRGTGYSELKDYNKAISDYNKTLEINPNNIEANKNLDDAKKNLQYNRKGNMTADLTPQERAQLNSEVKSITSNKENIKAHYNRVQEGMSNFFNTEDGRKLFYQNEVANNPKLAMESITNLFPDLSGISSMPFVPTAMKEIQGMKEALAHDPVMLNKLYDILRIPIKIDSLNRNKITE